MASESVGHVETPAVRGQVPDPRLCFLAARGSQHGEGSRGSSRR